MVKQAWRDVLEVAAVISVVGGLLLVAYEIRQANGIARAQAVMDLSAQYNEMNRTRFSDPVYADLNALLVDADHRELTQTEASMVVGMAYHVHNILWSAQTAYDSGLLSPADLDNYRNDLSLFLTVLPGIVPAFVEIYETQTGKQDAYVFEPLAELVEELRAEGKTPE